MTKIKIVESLPGTGKSYWMIEEMKSRPNEKWIFVTPFLDEAGECSGADEFGNYGTPSKGRLYEQAPDMNFKCPSDNMITKMVKCENRNNAILRVANVCDKVKYRRSLEDNELKITLNKSEHLLLLLLEGNNIAMTHNLFLGISPEAVEQISKQGYNVVVDETIEKVEMLEGKSDKFKDLLALIESGYIVPDDAGKLDWKGPLLRVFEDEYELCRKGILYLYQGRILIKRHSSKVYEVANQVYVLTYMFHASAMRAWMQFNGLDWEYLEPKLRVTTAERKSQIRNLIRIEKDEPDLAKFKNSRQTEYSSTWFSKRTKDDFELMRGVGDRLYRRWQKRKTRMGKGVNIIYTCFKSYAEEVAGTGTKDKSIVDPESSFVSKNARATNAYVNKDCVVYWVNVYPHMTIQNYLEDLVGCHGKLDSDDYALSEMIQFVFRSALRNGHTINLFIASDRMRSLFIEWLQHDG